MQMDQRPTLPPGPADHAATDALLHMARIKRESAERAESKRGEVLAALAREMLTGVRAHA